VGTLAPLGTSWQRAGMNSAPTVAALAGIAVLAACGNDRGQSAITDAAVRDSRPLPDARAGVCAGNYDANPKPPNPKPQTPNPFFE
jgi:hypothetical protein